ncbi:MAG: type IV pilus assembly protein PilM [Phycisphaerae bacterium]
MARTQVAWGIDVGTTSIKAMKLRRDGDQVSLESFDVVAHDRFLSEPDADRDETIRQSLRKFAERSGINRNDMVVVGVPGSTTFSKFVKLPPVEPHRVPEIVKFEAIQQVPFPLEQVNWDYQTFQQPDSPDVEVGIFAMKKEQVAQFMADFLACDIRIRGIQMAPLGVYNAAMYDGFCGNDNKGTVLLDLGAEHTDLIVIERGRLWLRTINLGGNAFTDILAKSFKYPFIKAEALKQGAATSKYAKNIFQAMRPVFADLVQELQRTLGFYRTTHRDANLERVICVGNPVKLPNLLKYLEQGLQMPVTQIEHFNRLTVSDPQYQTGLEQNCLGLAAAYGLALQGLELGAIDTNLVPPELGRQTLWAAKRPWFAASAAAVVVGVGMVGARSFMDRAEFDKASGTSASQRIQHDAEYNKMQSLRSKYNSLQSTYQNDLAQVNSFVNLAAEREIWPSVLQALYKALPQATDKAGSDKIIVKKLDSKYRYGTSAPGAAPVGPEAGPGPMSAAPATAALTKGFDVEIVGYATTDTPEQARQVVVDYANRLRKVGTKKGAVESYSFELDTQPFSGAVINESNARAGGDTGGTAGGNLPVLWGAKVGTLKQYFGPKDLPWQVGTDASSGVDNPAANAVINSRVDPDTRKSLNGAYSFVLKLRVVLK